MSQVHVAVGQHCGTGNSAAGFKPVFRIRIFFCICCMSVASPHFYSLCSILFLSLHNEKFFIWSLNFRTVQVMFGILVDSKSLEHFTYVSWPSSSNGESKSCVALNRIAAMSPLEKC